MNNKNNHKHIQLILILWGDLTQGVKRSYFKNLGNIFALISQIEPKNVNDALNDPDWIIMEI